MHLIQPDLHTRRAFLRRSTQLGLAGTALPFALNPYQCEVGARGAKGDVMLIEDADARAAARHAPGQRRSDQPAADHRNIVIRIHAILLSIMCAVRLPEKLSFVLCVMPGFMPGIHVFSRPSKILRRGWPGQARP